MTLELTYLASAVSWILILSFPALSLAYSLSHSLRTSKSLALSFFFQNSQCRPEHGDVAFSQPTRSGKAVMDHWGKGKVRVFVEDEQE